MEGSHKVTFGNLVDINTGKPAELEVPNSLPYEGGMLMAGALGEQSARVHLACIN